MKHVYILQTSILVLCITTNRKYTALQQHLCYAIYQRLKDK